MSDTSLSSRAILVSVEISQWDARRLDKLETEAVELKHNTVRRAARVHKSLLPGAVALERVHKQAGEIRTTVYKSTLPWSQGTQILRSSGYMAFASKMADMVEEYNRLVLGFLSEYPVLIDRAKYSLGTMFNPDDYPDIDTVRDKFKINIRYLPVPDATDWRVDLGEDAVKELRESVETQVKQSQANAMREVWDRLFDVVRKAQERLAKPDAVFRNSLVDNATELCGLLPSLNLMGDPRLDAMGKEIKRALCSHNPTTLRRDAGVRSEVARKLDAAMSKMSGMYGTVAG